MLQHADPNGHPTILFVEGALTVVAFAASFAWPRFGSSLFSRIERAFGNLARRRGLAVLAVGLSAFLLRVALLPICPPPKPFSPDDFSFMLAADTFAHGRLTNPTPAMWTHFESIHITMQPTYMSMYFPAQGLLLAAGKVLFGNPWLAVLAASAFMCAGICWMLQAWLPPGWALLGGILVILRLGLFSYWVNTYTGGGLITALGGALVLGALPRLVKSGRFRYGLLMSVGIIFVALTRPYEGLLLCLPVAVVLGHWALFGKNRPTTGVLLRRAAFPLALIAASIAWLGFYDYRAFGSPLTLPYTVNRATYAIAPYYVWQAKRPEPVYRHQALRVFYHDDELKWYERIHSVSGFLPQTLLKGLSVLLFFAGIVFLPPFIMLRRVLMDRRIRFLVIGVLVMSAGMLIEIYVLPHYLAPFTAAFYAIFLQALRHLRVWHPERKPVGKTMVRLTVALCFALCGVRLFAVPLHLMPVEWPPNEWIWRWYGPGPFGYDRVKMVAELEKRPKAQLLIVRYSPNHVPLNEWVYNGADIDDAKVVWAREMDTVNNLELIRYYHDREVWLVQPDSQPVTVTPYPVPTQLVAATH